MAGNNVNNQRIRNMNEQKFSYRNIYDKAENTFRILGVHQTKVILIRLRMRIKGTCIYDPDTGKMVDSF